MRLRRDVNAAPRVLIGGVGYHWFGDGSFGLIAADRLASFEWPSSIAVADLGYGAHYVAFDLADADPPYTRLILLTAIERGREPGTLARYDWSPRHVDPEEIQERIREAGGGVVDIDHLLVIAQHFDALPPEVTIFELEPVHAHGEALSDAAARRLEEVIAAVREEALRTVAPDEVHA